MTNETIQLLQELRQRTTRIESRLCRLGDHVGAILTDNIKHLRIEDIDDTEVEVHVPALDVSLSALLTELKNKGKAGKIATIWFDGKQVAQIYPQ